jgi:hypothetical protein
MVGREGRQNLAEMGIWRIPLGELLHQGGRENLTMCSLEVNAFRLEGINM